MAHVLRVAGEAAPEVVELVDRFERLAFHDHWWMQLYGRSKASTSTSVDTGGRSRMCTCMPFDLGADISIEAYVLEPLASAETRSEASAAVQSSRPTSSAYSSLLAVTSPREGPPYYALAGDVVQPENSVQPECKTLRAENIALDDASSALLITEKTLACINKIKAILNKTPPPDP